MPRAAEFRAAYAGKRALVTGHTGFKGGWLTVWLHDLGATVTGYAQDPDTEPSFFDDVEVAAICRHRIGDIRNLDAAAAVLDDASPDIVFHLAAQSLVRRSYEQPIVTIETNILGTANLLEAVRWRGRPCAVVVVTSDKCYENREWVYGYRETDPLGGHDLYSASKGAAELVVASYRRSFFPPDRLAEHGVALASARAGNVVGGGDWNEDRLVPDLIRALSTGRTAEVRNPQAVRPWQHVLEPLGGYLLLGARLMSVGAAERARFCEAWNFGSRLEDIQTVERVATAVVEAWGGGWKEARDPGAPHEAAVLRLSIDKACSVLGWSPRWGLDEAIARAVAWYRSRHEGLRGAALREVTLRQIREYAQC